MLNIEALLDQIEQATFTPTVDGYNPDQVDSLLNDVMDALQDLEAANAELQQQLLLAKSARPAAAPAPVPPVAAQSDSSAEVAGIVKMAYEMKTRIIAEAEAEAARIKAGTGTGSVAGLAAEKARLESEIAGLKKAAAEYRESFESLLAAQQEAIEKATNLF